MELGLSNARLAMQRVAELLRFEPGARELKVLVECNRLSVETIRTIRGLDEGQGSARADQPTAQQVAEIIREAYGVH
jgi:hypothetical protein